MLLKKLTQAQAQNFKHIEHDYYQTLMRDMSALKNDGVGIWDKLNQSQY